MGIKHEKGVVNAFYPRKWKSISDVLTIIPNYNHFQVCEACYALLYTWYRIIHDHNVIRGMQSHKGKRGQHCSSTTLLWRHNHKLMCWNVSKICPSNSNWGHGMGDVLNWIWLDHWIIHVKCQCHQLRDITAIRSRGHVHITATWHECHGVSYNRQLDCLFNDLFISNKNENSIKVPNYWYSVRENQLVTDHPSQTTMTLQWPMLRLLGSCVFFPGSHPNGAQSLRFKIRYKGVLLIDLDRVKTMPMSYGIT